METSKEELIRADVTDKELIALLQPGGSYALDWQATERKFDGKLDAGSGPGKGAGKRNEDRQEKQNQLYNLYMHDPGECLLRLGFADRSLALSESLGYLQRIALAYVRQLSLNPDVEQLRERVAVELEEEEKNDLLQNAPFLPGAEYLDEHWLEQIWISLHEAFGRLLQGYDGRVEQLFAELNPQIHLVGRIFFHLVESKEGEPPFSFLATYSADVTKEGKSRHLPLRNALVEYGENSMKLLELLSTVSKAAQSSELIAELVETGEIFHPLGFASDEAYIFLKEIEIYEEAGIVCRIPKWWRSKNESLKLSVSVGGKEPSRLSLDALVDFRAELWLGGQAVDADELRQLLAEAEGLTFIKGRWVEVNHEKLKQALAIYEQAQKLGGHSEMSIAEAMRFRLNAGKLLNAPEEGLQLEVTNGQWLQSVVSQLTRPETIDPVDSGDDFRASLRIYQERGLNWLNLMKSLGLGACLADDMGLGKTIQVIALLNSIRSKPGQKKEKALLIVPASLIGNWLSEVAKFAPALNTYVVHPSGNKQITDDPTEVHEVIGEHDLFLTTYGMLAKYSWLSDTAWDMVILDEAQAIKNPGTKQTKLVKQLKAAYRIALTGTPIENRLSDLWSLFDFLNKGLLGSAKEFTNFARRLRDSQDGYARLKQVVGPFILRRLKTDKSVISDLPEKIEMKTYSTLTKKQVVLYNKLVRDLKDKLSDTEESGIERKGLVLASLMRFKQICNHPDQFLGQGGYAEEESGKFARLREICETIYEKRERVLIFTQFKEITESLRVVLERIFEHRGLVLHGETAVAKRQELVAQFQGRDYVPFMVLSIKAGGVGLNLTSANHVIHFDRWWNPAVENQATDRAFRIGQQKNVIVHKFITKGTIEEKIDLIIESKSQLSQDIIPDKQESWITEMDNKQLLDLFALS